MTVARRLGSRLLWFVALWVAGVAAVGAVAFLLRSVLRL
ncbi:DUF2474 family protein [Dankookia rubra]|uniref:DUF2474 family protein n=1 Tax=Dankookia rubra TaxID=1442381 RepID=A0A4R5QFN3_9PROT|nr:DUF2474 family protein [Dankookia rubra]